MYQLVQGLRHLVQAQIGGQRGCMWPIQAPLLKQSSQLWGNTS